MCKPSNLYGRLQPLGQIWLPMSGKQLQNSARGHMPPNFAGHAVSGAAPQGIVQQLRPCCQVRAAQAAGDPVSQEPAG